MQLYLLSVPCRCWYCNDVYHLDVRTLDLVPLGSLLQADCPHCEAKNVFHRVPAPDYVVPGNAYSDQPDAYWGELGGPNLRN